MKKVRVFLIKKVEDIVFIQKGGIDIKSFRSDTSYRPETYEIQQIMTIYILPNLSGAYPLSWPAYHA